MFLNVVNIFGRVSLCSPILSPILLLLEMYSDATWRFCEFTSDADLGTVEFVELEKVVFEF
jgi:hypothetical protein